MGSDISYLNPENLRFSKDHITDTFDNGISLEHTYNEILNGNLDIDSLPPLKVVKETLPFAPMGFTPNYWVAKGNRRLYLYRQLKTIGAISTVRAEYDDSSPASVQQLKRQLTTRNGGQSVTVKTNSMLGDTLNATGAAWQERAEVKDKYGKILLGAAAVGVLVLVTVWATSGDKATTQIQRM